MLRSIAATMGLLVVLSTSLAQAAPCAGFIDVQDTDLFCTEITWMKNRAITLGCTANQYCPAQYVRRDQMAAFIYRLGVQNAFLQGGNAFGTTAVLGTTDDRAVQINVGGNRALLLEAASNSYYGPSPNFIGGHAHNSVAAASCPGICIPPPEPVGAVIAGGGRALHGNRVTDSFGAIGGGFDNQAGNDDINDGNGEAATVAGGLNNTASGAHSVVSGGGFNIASGHRATVPGGSENEASGNFSFAAGMRAKALHPGCFVWGDQKFPAQDITCSIPNQFVARATGGVRFVTAVNAAGTATAGVELLVGDSSWNVISDRDAKANWRDVDVSDVLEKLAVLPIGEWNYRTQPDAIRHLGPSAQDFRAAFGLGHGNRTISTIDADGVALAAIQGLNRKLDATVAEQAKENARLRAELAELRSLKEDVARIRAAQSRDNLAQR